MYSAGVFQRIWSKQLISGEKDVCPLSFMSSQLFWKEELCMCYWWNKDVLFMFPEARTVQKCYTCPPWQTRYVNVSSRLCIYMHEDCEHTLCLQPKFSTKKTKNKLVLHAEMLFMPMISIDQIVLSSEVAYLCDRKNFLWIKTMPTGGEGVGLGCKCAWRKSKKVKEVIPMWLMQALSEAARLQLRVNAQKASNSEGCLHLFCFFFCFRYSSLVRKSKIAHVANGGMKEWEKSHFREREGFPG